MMTRQSTVVVPAAVLILAIVALPGYAQHARIQIPTAQLTLATAAHGAIQGVVLDTRGAPLAGAMVSALGSTVAFALSGRDGRFSLDALPMGAYAVRVHLDGFAPSRRQVVDVRGGAPAMVSVALQSLAVQSAGTKPAVLTAGLSPFDATPAAAKGSNTSADVPSHDHTETAWRLRHLKRSVLKTVDAAQALPGDTEPQGQDEGSRFGRAFDSSLRFASSLFSDLPLSGQVNLVTSGSFGGVSGPESPESFASASLAYIVLRAPVGRFGEWNVRGSMQQGDVGSWYLAGAFSGRIAGAHRYSGGVAYGAQQVEPLNLLGRAAFRSGSRATGAVYGFDEWTLGRRVSVNYGLAYAWQDYLSTDSLFSPRVAITVSPARQYRVRAVVARYATAPGADELIPSAGSVDDGAWLPARRSFSAWSDPIGFRAQRTDHLELAIERIAQEFVVGFRTFYQRTNDQMGAVFAAATFDRPAASLGHYYVATVGDPRAYGWSLSLSRPIIRGLRGAVDYSRTTTTWEAFADGATAPAWFGTTGIERFHDLTTSLQTDIPQTATRLYVLYRLNTAFSREDAGDDSSGLDSRFDVQLNQGLPFMSFTSADWEVLVAVRNLFRDPLGERSVFDELLVVRPPTRIVGGVRVRF
ncbi:MAG: TonB-dependent receptor [Vicinamibacterales bacterium]|nr:TonB-dependent receptor [Vicinamibacterales bacterium]